MREWDEDLRSGLGVTFREIMYYDYGFRWVGQDL
jgi:hypothetical protein